MIPHESTGQSQLLPLPKRHLDPARPGGAEVRLQPHVGARGHVVHSGVSHVTVMDGARVDRTISFFEPRDGRIWRMAEHWHEPDETPAWRSQWVERVDE